MSLKELQNKLSTEACLGVGNILRLFMLQNPSVTAVSWTQGTPSYNDGDACEFSVHRPEVYVGPVDGGNDFEGVYGLERAGHTVVAKALEILTKDFNTAEDLLLMAYGNNVQVTVTPTEIKIEAHEDDY